jgi:hypothetical protein
MECWVLTGVTAIVFACCGATRFPENGIESVIARKLRICVVRIVTVACIRRGCASLCA